APPERIIEIRRVMHIVTGYKNSVTMARPMSGEVATQTMTVPRRRAGQLRRVAPVRGGKCYSLGFCISLHRAGEGGHTYGTYNVGGGSRDAVFLGIVERRGEDTGQKRLGLGCQVDPYCPWQVQRIWYGRAFDEYRARSHEHHEGS